ncbi:GMC oxidoreductase [Mycobacterium sp. E2479]|uniref:GMC oxidoreductase n=1 Tax=Mycobacterium sp. E2479 TaxID=1834134 RepID=UPI0007FE6802|nr:GMC family oxidoreductase [Mycobacterium sp. E2479]OBH51908.1 cholesterol oxidase [Mycobacterium sp. E2479]
MTPFDYDVVVIGSGFGGSVTALRLSEKGYRVGVLEAGRRFRDEDFAKNSWHVRDYLFKPAVGCYGIQRIDLLSEAVVLSGAGVGGGSLVYANTLYEPGDPFYADARWSQITDWKDELAAAYDQAKRMLGVVTYPRMTPSDKVMLQIATDLGVADSFHATRVGVCFDGGPDARGRPADPGAPVGDPYFGGAGPDRNACLHCGECMTGCRHNAKNTLVKNYLYLAEKLGAKVHPLTTVVDVRPRPGWGFDVMTRRSGGKIRRRSRTFTAEQVVFSAAALGTQRLLHRLRDRGSLPHVSSRLGELSRTNSEAILAVRARRDDVDYSEGVAITSSIHPDSHTHVEPCRYGHDSNLMGLLGTILVDGMDGPGKGRGRWRTGLKEFVRQRQDLRRLLNPKHWSEQTIPLLVMQTHDNSLTTYTRRSLLGRRMATRQGVGEPNPTWIPVGHEVARRAAKHLDGIAGGAWADLADIPMTGHFIGGCVIGETAADGVVDPYHRMHGHPGLHVIDGSTITANLGVNPSLTITALAERATSLWPNKREPDPRPPLGSPYLRVSPVAPTNPAVPASASGALRLAYGAGRT